MQMSDQPQIPEENDDLVAEDLDLEHQGLGSIFAELRQEQNLGDFDLEEPEAPAVRRAGPQFGPLLDPDEEPPPSIGTASSPFEADGAGDAPAPSFDEAEAETEDQKQSGGGIRGKLRQIKEVAAEERRRAAEEKEDEKADDDRSGGLRERLRAGREKPLKGPKPEVPEVAEDDNRPTGGFLDRFVASRVKATEGEPQEEEPIGHAEPRSQPETSGREEIPDLGAEPGEETNEGLTGLLRQRLATARKVQQKDKTQKKRGAEGAGLDLSPPKTGGLFSFKTARSGEGAPTADDGMTIVKDFEKMLTPLSGPELAMLQAEVAADDTIFAQIDRSRSNMATRHRIGFMVGVMVLVLFALWVGSDYFTDTLQNAAQPSWLPAKVKGDDAAAGLFALGILFPILAMFVVADGVRYLLTAVSDIRLDDLLLAVSAGICSMGVFLTCEKGYVVTAGCFLLAYLVILIVARLLGIRRVR